MADEHLDNQEKQLLNFIRSGLNVDIISRILNEPLDRDEFHNYLQLMLDKPEEINQIVTDLINKLDSFEPGTAIDSMNKWFGHKSLLGAIYFYL